MIKFNTTTLEVLSTTKLPTAMEVVKTLSKTLDKEELVVINPSLIVEDVFAVIDHSMRCGLYQGFTIPFGYRLALNGYTLEVRRVPVMGKIIFKLTTKSGYTTTTSSLMKLKDFLKDVAKANMIK